MAIDIIAVHLVPFVVGVLWLQAHWRLFDSLLSVLYVTPYGVVTEVHELFWYHYRFFLQGWFIRDREQLLKEVESQFRTMIKPRTMTTSSTGSVSRSNSSSSSTATPGQVNVNHDEQAINDDQDSHSNNNDNNVVVAHSCRVIFLSIMQALLDEAWERTGQRKIRICLATIHFGSFYKLLTSLHKPGECEIQYYEVDFREDYTLDQNSVDPVQVRQCDVIFCQHIFGVPLEQDIFWQLGQQYGIPVVEDCVQSGSLYGKYKGHPSSDIILWSGGLDKTPSCLGGGFAHFRNTKHGLRLYDKVHAMYNSYPVDSFTNRFISVLKQSIHLIISKNAFYVIQIVGTIAYFVFTKRGEYIKMYPLVLKVRQDQSLAPFEHSVTKFCRRPSVFQLLAMRHGLSKTKCYEQLAQKEIRNRRLLLAQIPEQYHTKLWPWLTKRVIEKHEWNQGIQEFSWVTSEWGRREKLLQFLNDNYLICLINTTWDHPKNSKPSAGSQLIDHMVYLPNCNEMNERQVIHLGGILRDWCRMEYEHQPMKPRRFNAW